VLHLGFARVNMPMDGWLKNCSRRTAMKIHYIVLFVFCGTLSGCNRSLDATNSTSGTTPSQMNDYDEQVKRQQAQLDAYDNRSKQADEQLQAQAAMQKRGDALLAAQEQLLKRQQEDIARFQKILDTWESQQKQYQKYLDSLPK
jgi:hypothetical protein